MNRSKKDIPCRFYLFILTLYLILSVVNWLPIVSTDVIRFIKYLLFIYIFIYEIKNSDLRYPSLFLSPIGLIIVLLSMSFGLYLSFDFNALVDIILPFLILWIFNFKRDYYYRCIRKASLVIAFICFFSIVSYITGVYNIKPNASWSSTFGQAAFGGYSTGYSNSLFLFVPFLVFWHRKYNKGLFAIETFAILTIIVAQYISGGRGGFLASLLVFFMGYRFSIIYKGLLIVMLISFVQSEEFLTQMRIVNDYGEELDSDRISSGRIRLMDYYINKFNERPLFGYGFGSKEGIDEMTVHIVWLKNVINGGLCYLFFLILIFARVFSNVIFNRFLTKEEMKLFYILFIISFLITFLEPNYLIGSVQGEFVYWLLISLLLKREITDNTKEDQNTTSQLC
jgi:O-antigen ligase